jgi:hypothetical protein
MRNDYINKDYGIVQIQSGLDVNNKRWFAVYVEEYDNEIYEILEKLQEKLKRSKKVKIFFHSYFTEDGEHKECFEILLRE